MSARVPRSLVTGGMYGLEPVIVTYTVHSRLQERLLTCAVDELSQKERGGGGGEGGMREEGRDRGTRREEGGGAVHYTKGENAYIHVHMYMWTEGCTCTVLPWYM